VKTFGSVREAKEFLVNSIVTEAQRKSVPLSETERKMMYFSETGWTLPDMADVNDAFDREYDQAGFEEKIGALARNFCADSRKNNRDDFESWTEAVRTIRGEDHYLLVLVSGAGSKSRTQIGFLKLLAIGIGITCVIFAVAYVVLARL
jgi:hypothetical protein